MTGPARYGWGIVGTGNMAAAMASALAGCAAARLAAVASREMGRAEQFALAHGAGHPCRGLDEMLARADVDICYIATPAHRHHDDCLAALAAGKHVLCEKPLAMNASQARAIAAAAKAAGKFCMEALWTQFLPAVTEAARLLDSGAIGTGTHIAASFGLPTDAGMPVFMPPGGGALLDRGVYPISLALRLFGAAARVRGSVTRGAYGVDTAAVVLLDFAGGGTAALATSLTAYLGNDLVISGTGGRITLQEPITSPSVLTVGQARAGVRSAPGLLRRLARRVPVVVALARLRANRSYPFVADGYGHQLDEVHRCLEAGRMQSTTVPLALSIATLEVIDALNRGEGKA